GPVTISSRHNDNVGNSYAADFIKKKLLGYGLKTYTQEFLSTGENIYAVQTGVSKPNQHIIVCAHYDTMPVGNFSPGADDDGSGTVAVLEAARILSKYKFDYTIIYALWDREEQGLQGSNYYAQLARSRNDSIVAVINLDMLGWDGNNDDSTKIHTRDIANSNKIADDIFAVNNLYAIGLKTSKINPGTTRSDHASFWKYNYSAVLLIESFNDFNPFYHTSSDNIQNINKNFFEKNAKLGIGSLAKSAGASINTSVIPEKPTLFYLYQNYPNPFNPSTVINYTIGGSQPSVRLWLISLKIFDLLGREIATLVNEEKPAGKYQISWNGEDNFGNKVSSGIYFYVLYAGDYVSARKMVLVR
ncbi:MAG: M28 family peptidase, partial [Bacteroidota bacterium]